MKITIAYEASWRNSFLDGSNDEPLPKRGRQFVASMTELKKDENFIPRDVSLNTVLGILNRLIGDQRKLYQSRKELEGHQHFFEALLPKIGFEDRPSVFNSEIAYLRNMKGSTDQNSYTGVIRSQDPVFTSDYSKPFWGVLGLEVEELLEFILEPCNVDKPITLDPLSILNRLELIKKSKPVENADNFKAASDVLASLFPKFKGLNNKGLLLILPLYCSGLYLQMQRLEAAGFDMTTAKSKMGGIPGISNNGFTPKDFMSKYTSGAKKLIYGNPFIKESFVKGEGKIKQTLTKASGELDIFLDVTQQEAEDIELMIENAGVSSFYLGKKGLAYVSDIIV